MVIPSKPFLPLSLVNEGVYTYKLCIRMKNFLWDRNDGMHFWHSVESAQFQGLSQKKIDQMSENIKYYFLFICK